MDELRQALGVERWRKIELLATEGGWNGDFLEFIRDAVDSYLSSLRPDYVGSPMRKLQPWEPYPYDHENPEHVALYATETVAT